MFTHPADCVVGEVFAEMMVVVTTRDVGMFNVGGISDELRFVLRDFTSEKAGEILEAIARGPIIEGTGCGCVLGRCVVPFPPSSGAVALVIQHLGDGGAALGDDTHGRAHFAEQSD